MKIENTPHILCINPWIHDFAAFDFWAKPLGLLSIAACLRKSGIKISYIDCLDRFHPQMWDQAVKHSRFDLSEHPFFTNNTLFPCVKSDSDVKRIARLKIS